MKKTLTYISILIVLILLNACAAQNKLVSVKKGGKPQWLINPKTVYPETQYLTAIGEADTRDEAQNMAAANLSKIFEMKVHTDETTIQRAFELSSSLKNESSESITTNKNVNVNSAQTLMNVQFADSFTDKLGTTYVLAYINRMQTGELYTEKIEKNDKKIQYYVENSKKENNPLKSYALCDAAYIIAQSNEIFLQQLAIISPMDHQMIKLNYNLDELKVLTAEKAKTVTFQIDSGNDDDNSIKIILEEIMTDYGFSSNENGILNIKSDVRWSKTDLLRKDGFKFILYDIKIEIFDDKNSLVAAFSQKGREGHTTIPGAKARVIRKMEKKLRFKLVRKMNNYFDNLVKK